MVDETALVIHANIKEIDRKDDQQILASLGGELIDEYVYSFKDGRGRTQEGLSWAGVRELAQLRGNITLSKPEIEDHPDYIRAMVMATDLDRNVSMWGGTHQPKMIKPRDGDPYPDEFAFEKAVSKAQRNAIKNIMPTAVVKGVIAKLKGGGNGRGSPIERRPAHRDQSGGAYVADTSPGRSFINKGDLFTAAHADLGIAQKDALAIWSLESVEQVLNEPKILNGLWRGLLKWKDEVEGDKDDGQ